MADFELESKLDKLFADGPAFDDADQFARSIEQRLNRRWMTRRLLIGGVGGLGGLIGVAQLVGSGLFSSFGGAARPALNLSGFNLGHLPFLQTDYIFPPMLGGAVWMFVVLAGIGLALGVVRLIEEL